MKKTLAKIIRVLTYIGVLSLLGVLIQYEPLLVLQAVGAMAIGFLLCFIIVFVFVIIPEAFEKDK